MFWEICLSVFWRRITWSISESSNFMETLHTMYNISNFFPNLYGNQQSSTPILLLCPTGDTRFFKDEMLVWDLKPFSVVLFDVCCPPERYYDWLNCCAFLSSRNVKQIQKDMSQRLGRHMQPFNFIPNSSPHCLNNFDWMSRLTLGGGFARGVSFSWWHFSPCVWRLVSFSVCLFKTEWQEERAH